MCVCVCVCMYMHVYVVCVWCVCACVRGCGCVWVCMCVFTLAHFTEAVNCKDKLRVTDSTVLFFSFAHTMLSNTWVYLLQGGKRRGRKREGRGRGG